MGCDDSRQRLSHTLFTLKCDVAVPIKTQLNKSAFKAQLLQRRCTQLSHNLNPLF